jgi:hypothetical protein
MERFYNEEDDDEDEKNAFFGPNSNEDDDDDLDEEVVGYIDKQGIIDVMNMDLVQTKLNQHLLGKAIEIAKGNWFWFMKSNNQKIEEISSIFNKLCTIIDDYEKGIENEE